MADSVGADSAGHGTTSKPVVRRSVVLVLAAMWALAVLAWPGLPAGTDSQALGRESAVLIAAASIDGGMVVLSLTVGLIALQVLSQFSWRLNRTIIDRWLMALISAAVVGGVVLPLWVAVDPSPVWVRWAFTSFGWSVLLVASAAWLAAERIQPAWLVDRASRRALRLVVRSGSVGPDMQAKLAAAGAPLAELVASGWLPYAQFRKAVVSYVAVLATRCRAAGAVGDVTSDVRDLAAHGQESAVGARADAMILALGGLGIAQASCAEVHMAVWQGLWGLAARLRTAGASNAAGSALDALANVTDARVHLLLPDARIPELQPAPKSVEENRSEISAYFRDKSGSAMDGTQRCWSTVSIRPDGFGTIFHAPLEPPVRRLAEVVARFTEGDQTEPHELAGSLQALATGRHLEPQTTDSEMFRRRSNSSEAYHLLGDTAAALATLLPSPFPDSTGWPGGWQGHGELNRDVRRIAGLAAAPYLRVQYPPTDAIEETIEQIAAMLRREPMRQMDVPADRTGWRDPPTAEEEGGPASAPAATLGALMEHAFDAGFDRRALLTGRRILAAATSSAQIEDVHGLLAHGNAIQVFTRDAILHGPTGRSQAGRHRQRIVLAGMIAEIDQLLEHQGNPRLQESIADIASNLTWRAHGGDALELQTQMWQAKLAAAGWLVPLPGARSSLGVSRETEHKPLPKYLLAEAEEEITHELGHEDPTWAAATIITFWAHAAVAAQSDPDAAKRIAALLTQQVRAHDVRYRVLPYRAPAPGRDVPSGTRALHPQLRRLAAATIKWCKAADPTAPCLIRSAQKDAGTVQVATQRLLAQSDLLARSAMLPRMFLTLATSAGRPEATSGHRSSISEAGTAYAAPPIARSGLLRRG